MYKRLFFSVIVILFANVFVSVNNFVVLGNNSNSTIYGPVGGPKASQHRFEARSTDIFRMLFKGAEKSVVIVCGDGDTDLDLYIYDEKGNLVTSHNDSTDLCVCTFVPRWTAYFSIKIVNRGFVYNTYVLRTN